MNFPKRNSRTFLWVSAIWQPVTDFWAKATDWPVVGKYIGWPLNDKHYDVTFIPINQELEQGGSTVIPKQVVSEMIRRSSHRVIFPRCMCRVGCWCQDYPMEIGCIFMGEATKDIDPSLGTAVSVEEALAHVDRAMEAGLIPQIGRVDPDPFMCGVKMKDWDRFLTLCFCCPCCCIAMRNMPRWASVIKDRMHRLEGLSIEVIEGCDGCGKCAKNCFADAIVVEDKRARITDACKGCGICAGACPRGAIEISISDGNRMLEEAFRRIESYADIT
jgi:UDP-glucose 4-epimerase